MTLHIFDLWQYYVCFSRSGVTRCTLFTVLYLCRTCQRGLHAVLLSHIGTHAPPRCSTSQYRRTFIPLSVSLCNYLGDSVFDGVGLADFNSSSMPFYCSSCALPFYLLLFSLSLLSFYWLVLCGWEYFLMIIIVITIIILLVRYVLLANTYTYSTNHEYY